MPDAGPSATILHLTDLHLGGPADAPARGPARVQARLAAVLAEAAAMAPPPDAVVISGDLADHGCPEAYAALRAALAGLRMPVLLTLGNHDEAGAFAAAFGAGEAGPGLRSCAAGGVTLLGLDTPVPGRTGGAIAPGTLAALHRRLAAGAGPVVLALHHPPVPAGAASAWDGLCAGSSAALAAAVAGRPVAAILCGHIHRNAVRLWHGIPVITNEGLASAIDPCRRDLLVVTEGASAALVRLAPAGLAVDFVALAPARAEIARVEPAGLLPGD
jgi:3',5'-cyclic AMP phosphodiesterase CpdA